MSINSKTGRSDAVVRSGIAARLAEIQARAGNATDKVNEYMGDTIYACSRDHSGWGHGTMGLDDFYLACRDSTIAESLVEATANADVPALTNGLESVLDYVARCEESGITMQPGDIRRLIAAALGGAS